MDLKESIKEVRQEEESQLNSLEEGDHVFVYDPSRDLMTHAK